MIKSATLAVPWNRRSVLTLLLLAALPNLLGMINIATPWGNPYLIAGNVLLGAVTGLLLKRGIAIVPAVWIAYAVQLPWLIATDYYLVGLPAPFIKALVIGLFISNTVWALTAQYGMEPLRRWLR